MDLRAYHHALNLGFSESESSRIGDDAWENNRQQPTCDPEPQPDYYDVLVAENTRLLATISRLKNELREIDIAIDDPESNLTKTQAECVLKMHRTISRLREALESIAGGEIYPVQVALDALMAEVEGTK